MAAGGQQMTTRLVIAVKQPFLGEAIANWLAGTGRFEVAGQARTGPQAIALVTETDPELLLLDVSLPGLRGLIDLLAIAERFPTVSVVVLAEGEDRETIAASVRLGAAGYVSLTWGSRDLLRVLGSVAAGKRLRLPSLRYSSASAGSANPRG